MKSSDLPKFYKEFGPDDSIDSFTTKIGTVCYTVQLENNVRVLALNDDKTITTTQAIQRNVGSGLKIKLQMQSVIISFL